MAELLDLIFRVFILKLERAGYFTLTLLIPMEFPIKFDAVKSGRSIIYIEELQV